MSAMSMLLTIVLWFRLGHLQIYLRVRWGGQGFVCCQNRNGLRLGVASAICMYICSCCAVVALGFGASIKVLIKSPTHLYNALLYATCNWIALNSIPLNGNSCGRVGCINNWVTDWLTVNWIAKQSSPRQAETP